MWRDTIVAAKKLDTKVSIPNALNSKLKVERSKSMLENLLSGLRKNENLVEADGPAKENWEFCIFEVKKMKYHVFKNGINSKLNIPLGSDDETLIMCLNFKKSELKTLLIDKLDVSPIMFYEWMLLSPIDKVYEFDDMSIFYNMVISKNNIQDSPVILRMIRKNNFAVIIMNHTERDEFHLSSEIASKFKFKIFKKMKFPKLFNKRIQKVNVEVLMADGKSVSTLDQNVIPNGSDFRQANSLDTSFDSDENLEIAKGEVGRVIIQRIKTIMPMKTQQISIDYILFWISSEGLKRIENFINLKLLSEINAIQEISTDLNINEKIGFLKRIDAFENLYISTQNAKSSKEEYFEKIIESDMASLEFRFLIRHLKSRMRNLNNTTFIIERKLTLAKSSFQMSIDTKMTENSEKLDKLMRQFSLISVMFLPLTIITGMWGMNWKVPYMVDDENYNLNCFYTLCGIMGGVIFGWTLF